MKRLSSERAHLRLAVLAAAAAGVLTVLAQIPDNPPPRDGGPPGGFDFPFPGGPGFGGPPPFGPGGFGGMMQQKILTSFDAFQNGIVGDAQEEGGRGPGPKISLKSLPINAALIC